jgi:hypothetical protein
MSTIDVNAAYTGSFTQITNSDGTLTISPTTGAVVASIALGYANTWTATQTFGSGAVISGGNLNINSSGMIVTYNGVSTAGLGTVVIVASAISTSTTGALASVATYTPPATAGRYKVTAVVTTTSGTNTGTVTVKYSYHDSQGNVHSGDILPVFAASGVPTTSATGSSVEFHSLPATLTVDNSASAITIFTTITGTVNYTVSGQIQWVA